jgi:hypothetical protein
VAGNVGQYPTLPATRQLVVLKFCTTIWSFRSKEEVRYDKINELLLPDVCKYNSKKIGFEVMGQGKNDKSNQGGT